MIPDIVYIWHQITARDIGKKAMMPFSRHSRLAESSFTSGQAYRFMVEEERRTNEQNRKMWPLLTEFAEQVEHFGHHWSPEDWKYILMHAFRKELRLLPGLDGSVVPIGLSTSALSKSDMIKFIEFIIAEGTERGVIFSHEPPLIDTQSASTVHLLDQTAANRRGSKE
jgi:hypothetical protein